MRRRQGARDQERARRNLGRQFATGGEEGYRGEIERIACGLVLGDAALVGHQNADRQPLQRPARIDDQRRHLLQPVRRRPGDQPEERIGLGDVERVEPALAKAAVDRVADARRQRAEHPGRRGDAIDHRVLRRDQDRIILAAQLRQLEIGFVGPQRRPDFADRRGLLVVELEARIQREFGVELRQLILSRGAAAFEIGRLVLLRRVEPGKLIAHLGQVAFEIGPVAQPRANHRVGLENAADAVHLPLDRRLVYRLDGAEEGLFGGGVGDPAVGADQQVKILLEPRRRHASRQSRVRSARRARGHIPRAALRPSRPVFA